MTTPKYLYDHETETHRRMQTDPACFVKHEVRLLERNKAEARVYLQSTADLPFNPWVLISGLDSKLTDDELKELAISRMQDLLSR